MAICIFLLGCWNNAHTCPPNSPHTYRPHTVDFTLHGGSRVDFAVSASSAVFYISFAVESLRRANGNRGWPAGWDHHLYLTHYAHKPCQQQSRTHRGWTALTRTLVLELIMRVCLCTENIRTTCFLQALKSPPMTYFYVWRVIPAWLIFHTIYMEENIPRSENDKKNNNDDDSW